MVQNQPKNSPNTDQGFGARWEWFRSALFKGKPSQKLIAESIGVGETTIKRLRKGERVGLILQKSAKVGLVGFAAEQPGAPPLPYIETAVAYLFDEIPDKPPPLREWLNQKAPVDPRGTTEASDSKDSPPPVPDLSDLEGVRNLLLALQQLIRENRRIRWSWEEFEKATAGDTVERLDQAGFPKWAQCWWDLVLSYERSRSPGFEVRQNLNITRGFWMRKTLRGGLGLP